MVRLPLGGAGCVRLRGEGWELAAGNFNGRQSKLENSKSQLCKFSIFCTIGSFVWTYLCKSAQLFQRFKVQGVTIGVMVFVDDYKGFRQVIDPGADGPFTEMDGFSYF